MGIFCQMNLFKAPDHAFVPGETISGIIKFAIHEPMEFDKITTSLKGSGQLKVRVKNSHRNKKNSYAACESYIDTDNVITATKISVPVGCHEIKFNFKLPERLPATLDYKRNLPRYLIKCRIKYYIRIKFERPGWFAFAKHLRKEIKVISSITPHLFMQTLIYIEKKKLMRLFSRKNANVALKATITNSVIPVGGKIQVNLEINNDSNIVIRSVDSKLLEVYTFKANGHTDVKIFEDVPYTDFKSDSIYGGVLKSWPLCINLPLDKVSLQNSKLVSRDYVVRIVAQLPIPHRNVTLDIPIQVEPNLPLDNPIEGDSVAEAIVMHPAPCSPGVEEAPPSYWEAMGEDGLNDSVNNEEIDYNFCIESKKIYH